jgi:hypothetical protein
VRWLLQQLLDLLGYWLLPALCFALPARPANGVARWVSGQRWLFRVHAPRALQNFQAVGEVDAPEAWQRRFRLVRFLDAVDSWHGRFSSDRRIARSLVQDPPAWPEPPVAAWLGTHLGPSTLFLRRLAAQGYEPRFVFRDLPPGLGRQSPVYHAYLRWRIGYLRKVCAGREIRVPGARASVVEALETPGVALVLLLDAPAERDRGAAFLVGGARLPIDPGGLGLAVERGVRGVMYTMVWDEALGRRVIRLTEAGPLQDREAVLQRMEACLGEALARDPAQWQLWLTARPVLSQTESGPPPAPETDSTDRASRNTHRHAD